MADAQVCPPSINIPCKNKVAGTNTSPLGTPANYASISAIRTRLIAINGTYFTTARMNQMTHNDLIYALRLADDPGTI